MGQLTSLWGFLKRVFLELGRSISRIFKWFQLEYKKRWEINTLKRLNRFQRQKAALYLLMVIKRIKHREWAAINPFAYYDRRIYGRRYVVNK
jgi:hypothetical protein